MQVRFEGEMFNILWQNVQTRHFFSFFFYLQWWGCSSTSDKMLWPPSYLPVECISAQIVSMTQISWALAFWVWGMARPKNSTSAGGSLLQVRSSPVRGSLVWENGIKKCLDSNLRHLTEKFEPMVKVTEPPRAWFRTATNSLLQLENCLLRNW